MTTAYTDRHILPALEDEILIDLHRRFVFGYAEWFCDVYCREFVPLSHPVISDLADYGRVHATWADFAEPNPKYMDYMRSWLNEDDEEPGEWDDDWQRQYDLYTR